MAETRRGLASDIAAARDDQLARIVALVDAMPARGDTDALIAPVRTRIQQLRPERPFRLGRLLFTPLDPVIVPTPAWRPGMPLMPRAALPALQSIVEAALASRLPAMQDALAGADRIAAARIGEALWEQAAQVLLALAGDDAPPAWHETGLGPDAFRPLRLGAGCVLANAAKARDWAELARDAGPDEAELAAAIALALGLGQLPAAMQMAVLLARLPLHTAQLFRAATVAGRSDPRNVAACLESAQDAAIDRLRSATLNEAARAPLGDAAQAVQRAGWLLAGLSRQAGPLRRAALEGARRAVDAQCRTRFVHAIGFELLEAAGTVTAATATEAVPRLEAAARDIRRLAHAAAQLGGAAHYEQGLRQAAERVQTLAPDGPFTVIDRVRLVEILAGPEEGLRALAALSSRAAALSQGERPSR